MSALRPILNAWLRTFEKRKLRSASPEHVRRNMERQARLLFYAPRGTRFQWTVLGDVPTLEVTPPKAKPDRVLLYFHGGAFIFGSPDTHKAMVANLANQIGARAVLPRYRLAPEHAFPAASQDARAAWNGMIASGIAPKDIVLGGDSAGGALAFGLIGTLCAEGMEMPGAVFGLSPLCDLTFSGDSVATNAAKDVLLPVERTPDIAKLFLCGASENDPSVSPLFARFNGAPPAWITVGDTEILADDARRLLTRMQGDGAEAELVIEHDLPHVWPIFHNVLPEARHTLKILAGWIRQRQGWEF